MYQCVTLQEHAKGVDLESVAHSTLMIPRAPTWIDGFPGYQEMSTVSTIACVVYPHIGRNVLTRSRGNERKECVQDCTHRAEP